MTYQKEQVVLQMETDATRKYPFPRETLDQIADLRHKREQELNHANPGKEYLVPAPVIIAEAVAAAHAQAFLP